MYKIEEREPDYFEFEYKGKALKVYTPAALPTELMFEYVAAADGGTQAVMQWLFGFFMEQTDGAVKGMPFGTFADLVKEWQDSAAIADLGK